MFFQTEIKLAKNEKETFVLSVVSPKTGDTIDILEGWWKHIPFELRDRMSKTLEGYEKEAKKKCKAPDKLQDWKRLCPCYIALSNQDFIDLHNAFLKQEEELTLWRAINEV